MAKCNDILPDADGTETPLWKGFTFHHFGLFLAAIFGLISVIMSLFLIAQHAIHYIKPNEQKHIIRIVFMIPVYSIVSFLSYLFWRQAIYFEVLRDCYEAFAISSFFALLCNYVANNLHDQKDFFRSITPKNWFLQFFYLQKCTGGENKGPLRRPRSGLTWFNIIWVGIFQYCFIRVFFTIVSVITEALDVYCESSLSPSFAHLWTVVFECLSVTVAMTMVVQFYIQLKDVLADHKPGLKVLSIKLVIFFSFWQNIIISLLSSKKGPLHPSDRLAYPDIKVGIPSVMLCIEMAGFSIMHLFAYSWKPYSIRHSYNDQPDLRPGSSLGGDKPKYLGGPFGIYAILDAFNPWDIIKASARGFRWLFVGYRHRLDDASYQPRKDSASTSYGGAPHNGHSDSATELGSQQRPTNQTRVHSYQREDDRAGLLLNPDHPSTTRSHSPYDPTEHYAHSHQSHEDDSYLNPHNQNPYRNSNRVSRSDIGVAITGDMKPSSNPTPYDDEDVGYHPGMGPPPGSQIAVGTQGSVHPAYRPGGPAAPAAHNQGERFTSSSPWAAPYPSDSRGGGGMPDQRTF